MDESTREISDISPQVGGKAQSRARLLAYKNLLILSVVFMLVFTSFNALQNLQTSIHTDAALGFASLCSIYSAFVLSCLFFPNLIIDRVGYKYSIAIAIFGYVLFIVAHFTTRWWSHITASVILGFFAAPLWTSKASYLTEIASNYANMINVTKDTVISRFFCIFYLVFQLGQVAGNTISSLVLRPTELQNVSTSMRTECGAKFTPQTILSPSTQQVGSKTVTLLMGIYLTFTCIAIVILLIFLDRINHCNGKERKSSAILILSTLKQMKDIRVQLLVPITVLNGLELAFLFGDFTKAFVTCSVGIEMVGFTMICFAMMNCLGSMLLGVIIKWTGTCILMVVGMSMHMSLLIFLLYWDVVGSPTKFLFIVAGIWGLCDNIWTTQINAIYGILFLENKVEALSLYKLWQSMGYVISFAYGNLIPVKYKIYVILDVLIIGMIFYGLVEYLRRQESKKNQNDDRL